MKLIRLALAPVLAPILALALALPAAAQIPLAELSRYLNGLSTATAEFTQVNSDGSVSKGTLYIKRPGRVRFEYATDKTLVIAGGGQVAIFDPKSNGGPEQYPLAKTPLNLILAANVDLAQAKMVRAHRAEGDKTVVTAQDPAHPEYGTIDLIFSAGPTELRQWVITDEAGGQTTVILGEMTKGGALGSSLFSIPSEIARRKPAD